MTYNTLSFGTHREPCNQDVVWLLQTDFPDTPQSQYIYFLQIRSPKHLERIYDTITKVTLKKYGDGPFYSASPIQVYNDVIALIAQLDLNPDDYTLIESLSDLAQ